MKENIIGMSYSLEIIMYALYIFIIFIKLILPFLCLSMHKAVFSGYLMDFLNGSHSLFRLVFHCTILVWYCSSHHAGLLYRRRKTNHGLTAKHAIVKSWTCLVV